MSRACVIAILVAAAAPALAQPDPWAEARAAMVSDIRQRVADGQAGGIGRIDPKILAVMGEVPRHLFVPASERDRAYSQRALDIGHESTISQPIMVAAMTDHLKVDADDVVLEVGTGSGYQAAVLARLVRQVYSIEIVEPLARNAARRLEALGYRNVTVRAGDGYAGWPDKAPFDAIIVTAGATHSPQPLVDQLKPGGRMVIPVGPADGTQELMVVEKDRAGRVTSKSVMRVTFIPLDERASPAPAGAGQKR